MGRRKRKKTAQRVPLSDFIAAANDAETKGAVFLDELPPEVLRSMEETMKEIEKEPGEKKDSVWIEQDPKTGEVSVRRGSRDSGIDRLLNAYAVKFGGPRLEEDPKTGEIRVRVKD